MNKLSYFKVGLFVIVASVIAVVGVVLLGVGSIFEKSSLVETYIDESVQGLDVGSAVKFRGVPIGKVEKISLTSAEYATRKRYVLVRVGIAPTMLEFPLSDPNHAGFRLEVERGLRLRLAAQGLTGVAYIEADYADPQRNPPLEIDWQPRYPYVPSIRSRITQLSESVEKILRSIESVDLGRLVDGMEKSLSTITKVAEGANVAKIGKEANAFLAEVRDTNRQLKEIVSSADLRSALKDTAGAAKGAREIIDNAEKPLKQLLADLPQASEGLTRLVKRLDSVANDLPETSTQLRQTIQRMNRLIANQQRDIERTLDNLRAISDNMKEITENSKKYPSQVLFGAPPPPSKAIQR
jgi:phospholipid/cholesterol/gamma-HCH transport system substrate-binding protein/paraquat-inducible protein B